MTKQCAVEDCQKKHYSKGWCSTHYQRYLKHGDPNWVPYAKSPIGTEKACNRCREVKSLDEFYPHTKTRDRRTTICKQCRRENDAVAVRNNWAKYGLSREKYDAMVATSGGVCSICHGPEPRLRKNGLPKSLSVDHCHDTGEVRGLLCSRCNTALGYFNHDAALLASAAAYLLNPGGG